MRTGKHKRAPRNANACRETQMYAGPQARALNFGEFSGADKAKEVTKIIGSILLCMRVTIPGTHVNTFFLRMPTSPSSKSEIEYFILFLMIPS
jgi:hypothetical protein